MIQLTENLIIKYKIFKKLFNISIKIKLDIIHINLYLNCLINKNFKKNLA